MKIAIVGNGNTGKALSYLLQKKHEVAVYDKLLDPPFYVDAYKANEYSEIFWQEKNR